MIIYSKSFPGGTYKFDGPDDAVYAKSSSGWVDSELFLQWMKKVFVKHCGMQRPVLLFLDGHASHVSVDVIDVAQENDVILFCLPPHTTHALQPLDVLVFRSLKSHFSKAVHSLCFTKKDFVVTKRDFARVVKVPFEKAFCISNIKSGFAKCGIHPYNPDAIDQSKLAPSLLSSSASSTTEESSPSAYPTSASNSNLDSSSISVTSADEVSFSTVSPFVSPLDSNSDSSQVAPEVTPGSVGQTSTPTAVSPCLHPLRSSTPQYQQSPSLSSPPHAVENPLVKAGLVPQHLSDILSTSTSHAADKKSSRRITGVRVLTANEYVDMVREKDKRKKEAEELKQKRKEERELKRVEKEKERERKNQEKRSGKRKARKGTAPKRMRLLDYEEEHSEYEEENDAPSSSRTMSRSIRPPQKYLHESSESDSSTTLCLICDLREPPIAQETIFWVDCDNCGDWAHTHCALGSNTATRNFICSSCMPD